MTTEDERDRASDEYVVLYLHRYKVEMSGAVSYDNIQSNSGVGVCHEQLK